MQYRSMIVEGCQGRRRQQEEEENGQAEPLRCEGVVEAGQDVGQQGGGNDAEVAQLQDELKISIDMDEADNGMLYEERRRVTLLAMPLKCAR
jgi:hypothetical protein